MCAEGGTYHLYPHSGYPARLGQYCPSGSILASSGEDVWLAPEEQWSESSTMDDDDEAIARRRRVVRSDTQHDTRAYDRRRCGIRWPLDSHT